MAFLARRRFVSALFAGLGQVAVMSGAEAQAPLEPGRISDGRLVGNVYVFDGSGRFSFGAGGGGLTGTYQLQGFALTLTFADGDVSKAGEGSEVDAPPASSALAWRPLPASCASAT